MVEKDVLVNTTVWNHIGKKYMIDKLHICPDQEGYFFAWEGRVQQGQVHRKIQRCEGGWKIFL